LGHVGFHRPTSIRHWAEAAHTLTKNGRWDPCGFRRVCTGVFGTAPLTHRHRARPQVFAEIQRAAAVEDVAQAVASLVLHFEQRLRPLLQASVRRDRCAPACHEKELEHNATSSGRSTRAWRRLCVDSDTCWMGSMFKSAHLSAAEQRQYPDSLRRRALGGTDLASRSSAEADASQKRHDSAGAAAFDRSANGGDLSWRPCYSYGWEKSMGMLLGIMFLLVTASLLTLVVDRLAQRLFPITDQQSANRRYAYRIVID
jgi:hypothetical protein